MVVPGVHIWAWYPWWSLPLAEFDADEVSCGEDAEQACVRSAKRRPMMIRDFLEGSTPKRSKAMESHNENERKR